MHNLIKIGLGLSLAIVYPFMVGFGIESFYTQPQNPYEICREIDPNNKIPTAAVMIEPQKLPPSYRDPQLDAVYKNCFDAAQLGVDIYNRNLFLMTTALGFLAIAIGTLLFSEKIGPVGPGLVFGGLFTILYGTTRSFRSLDKRWIFIELAAVFIGIIIVTWRFVQVSKITDKRK